MNDLKPGNDSIPSKRNPLPHGASPRFLLSDEDNRIICEILRRKKQTLIAEAATCLLITSPDRKKWKWKYKDGVVCLVRDTTTDRKLFIHFFSLQPKKMIFGQEIDYKFEYQMLGPTFMYFEAGKENFSVGLQFADLKGKDCFRNALDKKLGFAENRRINGNMTKKSERLLETLFCGIFESGSVLEKKLTVEDIGKPSNFRHVQHVNEDPVRGFDFNPGDKGLRSNIERARAGVPDTAFKVRNDGAARTSKNTYTASAPAWESLYSGTALPMLPKRTPLINSRNRGILKPPPPPPSTSNIVPDVAPSNDSTCNGRPMQMRPPTPVPKPRSKVVVVPLPTPPPTPKARKTHAVPNSLPVVPAILQDYSLEAKVLHLECEVQFLKDQLLHVKSLGKKGGI